MKLNNFGFGSSGGGGSDSITGSGTANKLAKFTDVNVIGDSQVTDNGTTVSIGGAATSSKALLELLSTTKGILIPRLTTTQINAIVVGATENSLLVFDTTIGKFKFYDHLSTSWKIIESSTIGGETLAQVLANGNTASGYDIEMGGNKISFGTGADISANTQAIEIHGENGVIAVLAGGKSWQFRATDLLTTVFGYQAIIKWASLTGNRTATFPNKNITVAGLDDVTTAINNLIGGAPATLDTLNKIAVSLNNDPDAYNTFFLGLNNRLKLNGTTPMEGDLDMTTNNVAVQTNKIKTTAGKLDWLTGLGEIIHDFTSVFVGNNFTQTWRAKSGTVAHLDDIPVTKYSDVNEISHTGNTSETVLTAIQIPANSIEDGDELLSYFQCVNTGVGGNKNIKVYFNTNPDISGSPVLFYRFFTNQAMFQISRLAWYNNGEVKSGLPTNINTADGISRNDGSVPDDAIVDFSIDQYLVVTAKLDNGGDVINLRNITLKVTK